MAGRFQQIGDIGQDGLIGGRRRSQPGPVRSVCVSFPCPPISRPEEGAVKLNLDLPGEWSFVRRAG